MYISTKMKMIALHIELTVTKNMYKDKIIGRLIKVTLCMFPLGSGKHSAFSLFLY